MLGQRIGTLNLAYTLPLSRPYAGWGTNPIFFRELGAAEFARIIEYKVNSRGTRTVRIWGADGWREWNGSQFV